ncbi:TPA: hypothetical protein I7682_17940 [Vibrio vulnificus]|nr:hypothetical protein [Vibrio vulnificus]
MQFKLLGVVFMLLANHVMANEYVTSGRYSESKLAPSQSQLDPMVQSVSIRFPKHIKTVGEAIRYVVSPTGYQLPEDFNLLDPALIEVGMKKLPISQRQISGKVSEVIRTLAGPGFIVVRDDVRRLIVLDYVGVSLDR